MTHVCVKQYQMKMGEDMPSENIGIQGRSTAEEVFGESFNDSYVFAGFQSEDGEEVLFDETLVTEEEKEIEEMFNKHYNEMEKIDITNPSVMF